MEIGVKEGGFIPGELRALPPKDLVRVAEGVRHRRAMLYDLAAFVVTAMVNLRSGVWMKKGRTIKAKQILGREPLSASRESKEDREARKASILAQHRKVERGRKGGR